MEPFEWPLDSSEFFSSDGFFQPDDPELKAGIEDLSSSFGESEPLGLFDQEDGLQQHVCIKEELEEPVVEVEEISRERQEARQGFETWTRNKHWSDGGCSSAANGEFCRKRMVEWILDHYRQEEAKKHCDRPLQQQQQQQPQQQQLAPETPEHKHLIELHSQQQTQFQPAQVQSPASYNHMLAERTRRSRETTHLTTLKGLIPQANTRKTTKLTILESTIDYIRQLQSQIVQLQEQSSTAAAAAAAAAGSGSGEQEVESLSPATNPGSMITDDNSSSAVHLSFNVNQSPDLIGMLTSVKELGLELQSINWMSESSSVLSLTVQPSSTKADSSLSKQALHEALAFKGITLRNE